MPAVQVLGGLSIRVHSKFEFMLWHRNLSATFVNFDGIHDNVGKIYEGSFLISDQSCTLVWMLNLKFKY